MTFFSLGALAAAALSRPKKAAALTAGMVMVTYIAYVLQGLSPDFSWLKNLSPFAYFNAQDIIATTQIDYGYALICGAVTLTALTLSYIAYQRRDFKV